MSLKNSPFRSDELSKLLALRPEVLVDLKGSSSAKARRLRDMVDSKLWVFDLDGTLFRTRLDGSKEHIPGSSELIDELKSRGRKVRAVTNDPGAKTVSSIADALEGIGIDIPKEDIFTPLRVAGDYFKRKFYKGSKIAVLGQQPLIDEINNAGMEAIPVEGADSFPRGDVDGILIGRATQMRVSDFGPVLTKVLSGTPYFGMNLDRLFTQVDENGNPIFQPGSGFIVSAIAVATNIEPKKIFGKPSKMLYDIVLNDACEKPSDSIMIGDTPDTDLMGAKSAGMKTALVWTGSLARGATTDYADVHLKGVAQFLRVLKQGKNNV